MRTLASVVAFAALLALAPRQAAASTPASGEPYLQVFPDRVIAGQSVSAYGTNFCAEPGCSEVTVTVGQRVVADGVAVGPDGSWSAAFVIIEPIGTYVITARQTRPDGTQIEELHGVAVAAGDFPPGSDPRTVHTGPPPPATTTSMPPATATTSAPPSGATSSVPTVDVTGGSIGDSTSVSIEATVSDDSHTEAALAAGATDSRTNGSTRTVLVWSIVVGALILGGALLVVARHRSARIRRRRRER